METTQKVRVSTIDEYIDFQPEPIRATLEQLRQTIKLAAPESEEVISYAMPAFKFHGMLAYFAAHKNHYGLYVPKVLHTFKEKLATYKTSMATIQFPYTEPVPVELITEIIKYAAKFNLDKELAKKVKKK